MKLYNTMLNRIKTKENGSSSLYIIVPVVLLLFAIIFNASMYMRAADIVDDNFKTSLDAATLAATVANIEHMLETGEIRILGELTDSTTLSSDEEQMVRKRFVAFEKALMSNVGLKSDATFVFSGGTCGWSAGLLSSGPLIIDEFTIYELTETKVYAYTINNITGFTTTPNINKRLCSGAITRTNGKVSGSTVYTTNGTLITDPTIYAKVSFPVEPPGFINTSLMDTSTITPGSEIDQFINGTKRVSKDSVTSLKIGKDNLFNAVNGNGWFD